MATDFLDQAELMGLGLAKCGIDVKISRRAMLIGVSRITISDHSRIDAFCIIAAGAEGISIGSYIHVGAYTSMQGSKKITLEDYCTLSSKVAIFSSNDDYSGACMTNPMIPAPYRHTHDEPVAIGRHSLVGCGSIILPGVHIGKSVSVGALSMVKESVDDFLIVAGVPARVIGKRTKEHLEHERKFVASLK